MKPGNLVRVALRVVWLALLVWVYIQFLIGWNDSPDPELGQAMLLKLLVLAGPCCWIVWLFLGLLDYLSSEFVTVGPLVSWTIAWVSAVIAGYVQWFQLVPWLWNWLRRKFKIDVGGVQG
jgi:hypothetical protein